jgi:HPt (histidine-containing phosphotransfer) domain-containing protein
MSDVLNQTELLEEIDGDLGLLSELYELFQTGAPRLVKQITDGLSTADAEAIWQNAHTLKSMVGNFCAAIAYAAAYRVELAGREERFDIVRQNLPLLEAEIARLDSAIAELLKPA